MAKNQPKIMSAGVKRAVDALRRPFLAFTKSFKVLGESRAELAPKLVKAYESYRKETGGSFVAFVGLLDPSVPVADRDAYRVHPSYQAANYLRRLTGRTDNQGARPLRSNLTIMARFIAALVPLFSDQEAFWQGIAKELELTPRKVTKLRQVTETVKPIADIKIARPMPVHIVHSAAAKVDLRRKDATRKAA